MTGLVNHSITNLINGVSQQAASVRLDNQVEEQINCFSDVTKGLTIRNGLELQNIIEGSISDRIKFSFTVDGVQYLLGMSIDDASPLIHYPMSADVEELAASIDTPSYFRGMTQDSIRVVEDSDNVYILNTTKKVGSPTLRSTYFDVSITNTRTTTPDIYWSVGSYRLTITSVADDSAGVTPAESPFTYDVTTSTTLTNIADAINASSITNEVGEVEVTGDRGYYRLSFLSVPLNFTSPTVTITTLSGISNDNDVHTYTPISGFTFSEDSSDKYYIRTDGYEGSSIGYFGGTSSVLSGGSTSSTSWTIGNTIYYRGTLQRSESFTVFGKVYYTNYYSIRREVITQVDDDYVASISEPNIDVSTSSSADRYADEAMIWVTGVSSEQEYTVQIDYEDSDENPYTLGPFTVEVGSTTTSNISLNWVAEQIRSTIDGYTDFTATAYSNAVYINTTNEAEFNITKITVDNNFDTTSLKSAIRATVYNTSGISDSSDLPPSFSDGFKVRIGDTDTTGSNYYLKYDSDFEGWKECGLDDYRVIDNYTMPYVISKETVRDSRVIELKPAEWESANSGDSESNEDPSFLGKNITDIFFYNSRLGFSTEDTLVLSAIGEHTTFFRTTCSQTIESDRVDIQLDSSRIGFSSINNVVSYDGKLFVNTASAQAVLSVNSSFELSTARLSQVSSYNLGTNPPLPVNNSLYFATSGNNRTSIFSYDSIGNGLYEATNLTKHIPYYLEGNIERMTYGDNVVAILLDDDRSKLYIQNRFSSGGQVLQNSWHRWELPNEIEYFEFKDGYIYLWTTVTDSEDSDYTFISRFDTTPQTVLEDTSDAYIGWTPYLDYYTKDKTLIENFSDFIGINDKYGTRYETVSEAYDSTEVIQNTLGTTDGPYYSQTSPVYYWEVDGNTNRVVFNDGTEIVTGNTDIEYFDYDGYRYTRGDASGDEGFYEVSRQSITTTTFNTDDIVYGIPFTASVTLSEIVPRQQNQDGSFAVLNYATLMLRRMRLYLGNSGVFTVNVDFEDRNDYTVKYTGQPLGKITIGRNSVSDINFRFPINGKSDKVTITITSDSSQPFNLLSAEWQGKFIQRGRSI